MTQKSIGAGTKVERSRRAVRLAAPLKEFLETEVASGIVLISAVVVAMIWANSPWSGGYDAFWTTRLEITAGPFALEENLRHWVNDALMVIFFFVVGLEVKREVAVGDLNSKGKAALPVAAAVGGMVVPAAIYLALNRGGDGTQGWAIPMATDIALALGVLALLSRLVPPRVRVLLLSLAIIDDIGAILVIAVFYSSSLNLTALIVAAALVGVIVLLRWLRVWWVPAYVFVGAGVWLAILSSGVHATIAGVILGLLAPARPLKEDALRRAPRPQEEGDSGDVDVHEARATKFRVIASVAPTERLAHALHPWSSFVILPVFALANVGISVGVQDMRDAATSPVAVGIVAGLVLGKIGGVSLAAALARRFNARLPDGVTMADVVGMAALAGIGLTMSLFISGLAFDDAEITKQAKMGILSGSLLSAIAAWAIFKFKARSND